MNPHIVAVFSLPEEAERAFHALQEYVKKEEISFLRKTDTPDTFTGDASADPVVDGMAIGSVVGGAAGLAFGMGTLLIPGIGPIIAAGPLLSLLAGATSGGIIGGFADLGINRYTSEHISQHLTDGQVVLVVGVSKPELRGPITHLLEKHGAVDIHEEPVIEN
ncbi:DUF1269 domain-containing protein [Aneurinibacillus migulanus]|uniref:Uncharacterized membrane protein n=1 Tax=Aneurinibacillus migulanus TaxID=47500 RepID=A0A0K2WIT3_ANEMI|nr:DUF1269 domain-containing protein [Aneurinibacillus migulanus]MCP1355219.1 DUF1269 domain-containing protein [Aneurinibacillus migulanus]MED0896657.1 DUF1269 domain-containing protein [Aneurinibacillus migulanus]MED1617910.1 DUF1269 domain-containing protein [Aneurinibacillus migulanus]MED4729128.1 DUF1269 domain-containing protein [Aneurinibacillus migulanus]CEH31326.1 Uncharacterized protein BN1090_A2_03798 [Aneurinibacillus migulanus]